MSESETRAAFFQVLFSPSRKSSLVPSVSSGLLSTFKAVGHLSGITGWETTAPLCWFTRFSASLYLACAKFVPGIKRKHMAISDVNTGFWGEVQSKLVLLLPGTAILPLIPSSASESPLTVAIPDTELNLISWTFACCPLLVAELLLWNPIKSFWPFYQHWTWVMTKALCTNQDLFGKTENP